MQTELDIPGIEKGKRSELIQYGVRFPEGNLQYRAGDVVGCSEYKARWLTSAAAQDELPYHGYPRNGELVTRTVVTYTGPWELTSKLIVERPPDG